MPGNYVLITPARNEAATMGLVIEAVRAQTHPPERWIVVDDGSSDETLTIVMKAASQCDYISVVHRSDRGRDDVGGGVVDTFLAGIEACEDGVDQFTYIGKLDADATPHRDYFERLCRLLDDEPMLGIASGQNWVKEGAGPARREGFAPFHPVGSARLWRTSVFRGIGGLVRTPGWDTLDVVRARLRGYDTRVVEELQVIHLRGMGKRGELRDGTRRLGRISYLLGYHPIYFAVRVLQYARRAPLMLRSVWLVSGYLSAWRRGDAPIVTADEQHWLRRYQLRRLIGRG